MLTDGYWIQVEKLKEIAKLKAKEEKKTLESEVSIRLLTCFILQNSTLADDMSSSFLVKIKGVSKGAFDKTQIWNLTSKSVKLLNC